MAGQVESGLNPFRLAGWGAAGLELALRLSRNTAYRLAAAVGLGVSFLVVWSNGAVGIIGNENDPINLAFFGILAIGLIGALVARFRAEGLALTLAAMAVLMLAMAGYVLATNPNREAAFIAVFAGLWLASAMLFRKAALETAKL